MKVSPKIASLLLAVCLLGGCAAVPAPVETDSSATASVLPPISSQEERVSSAPPPSSEAVSSVEPMDADDLAEILTALERTGADEPAAERARRFLVSAPDLPQCTAAMRKIVGLCIAPQLTEGLSEQIAVAAEESGIKGEAFRLAAVACRERGMKTADSVTVTFTGDCTFSPINEESHSNSFDQVYARQDSDSYPFDRMFPWFATDDITCINFEGTLTKSLAHAQKTYYFRGDPSIAKILPTSSVELAGLVNNHTMDYFQRGYDDTVAALTDAGVSLITKQQPYITTVNGIEVVFIGEQQATGANAAVKTVKQYKRADNIVVVVLHWSTEFSHQAAPVCVTAGHNLIDAGADLIIGHHPHILQGVELYRDKYIVYSLGNFAFAANVGPITSPYTMAFRARFTKKDGKAVMSGAEIVPCCPSSDPSGWNNYQPGPLFGEKARKLADFVVSLSASLPYGVKELPYFDF